MDEDLRHERQAKSERMGWLQEPDIEADTRIGHCQHPEICHPENGHSAGLILSREVLRFSPGTSFDLTESMERRSDKAGFRERRTIPTA